MFGILIAGILFLLGLLFKRCPCVVQILAKAELVRQMLYIIAKRHLTQTRPPKSWE
jgi:hypothetical protein